MRSISDVKFDEYFGFTDEEVRNILSYYGFGESYDAAKEWYDGYRFGRADIYCPWDVINFCDLLDGEPGARPQNFWINSSGNYAVRKFVEMADGVTKKELEALVAGETIVKEIREDLTYSEIYENINNLRSLLYTTGYLTKRGEAEEEENGRVMRLGIPNKEVRDVYVMQILDLFDEGVREDGTTLKNFCDALEGGDAETAEKILTQYLRRTISILDTDAPDNMKEKFYHGLLLGILGVKERWTVSSNRESGEGFADIIAVPDAGDLGIVIEVKYAPDGQLDRYAKAALGQIESKDYAAILYGDGVDRVIGYGVAFYKKRCRVMTGRN